MPRVRRSLVAIALAGWVGALVAQVLALRSVDDAARSTWTVRRNQCLLVSSVSMNTAVLLTGYRLVRRFRGGDP